MSPESTQQTNQQERLYHPLLPYAIIFLAAFFYVYEFYLRVMPSAMTHELMRSFATDSNGLGWISSLFFWGYAFMQIPAGLALDRYGPRILLSIMMLFCAGGALIFGMTESLNVAYLSRFIIGFSSSFAFVGSLLLASRWFPARYFALITGLVQFMGSMGAIAGESPIAWLVTQFGWRPTAIWSAVSGIIFAVLIWAVVRDRPPKPINVSQHKLNLIEKVGEMERLRRVLSHPQTWWVGIYAFCCWAPISIFAGLWAAPFLMQEYSISATTATNAMVAIWLGNAFASPLVGWWSNRINNRRIPLILSSVLAIASSLGILYLGPISWGWMYVMLAMFGAAAASQSVTFGLVQDIHPPSVAGTAVGFNNMAVIFGGVILIPIVGIILKAGWTGQMHNGVPIYSMPNFQHALLMLPICGVLSLIVSLFFIRETHCKAQYDLPI